VGLGADLDDKERRKFFPLPGLELRLVELPVRSQRHIDCAIPTPKGVPIIKQKLNRKLDGGHFSMLYLMQFLQARIFLGPDEAFISTEFN
jgi:hypothetical protein